MGRQGTRDRPRDEQEREQRDEVVKDLELRSEDSAAVVGGGLKIDGVKGESSDRGHGGEISVGP